MQAEYIQWLIASLWLVMLVVTCLAARQDARAPADDIGVMFLFALCIYSTAPPLSWLMQSQWYDESYGGRLFDLQPSADENVTVLETYLAAAIGFAAVYLRKRGEMANIKVKAPLRLERPIYRAALIVMLLGLAVNIVLMLIAALQATSYADSYRVINELPVFLKQAINFFQGITAFVTVVVLVGILQRLPKSWPLVVTYVTVLILSYNPEGARTNLIIGLLALLVAWHILVRRISGLAWLSMAAAGLLLFELLGAAREAGSRNEAAHFAEPSLRITEADYLWANAIDMLRFSATGGSVPPPTLYEELYAFIPSQLLPFEKLSLSVWFVNEFYPVTAQEGGGWAFGLAAQCLAGYGLAEAAVRGALLAMVALWLMKKYREGTVWWGLPLHLYCFSFAYRAVRVSSFVLILDVIQFVIPSIIILGLIAKRASTAPGCMQPMVPTP